MASGLTRKLEEALRSSVSGEVLCDAATLERYSQGQGWYRIRPIAILQPADEEDLRKAVLICGDMDVAIIPRGAATGLAGQAVGYGLIVDTTKHLTQIDRTSVDRVVVGPGVVLQQLNESLRSAGRWFPIDPTSSRFCTLGGMAATNAAGWHGPAFGSTKDHVIGLRLVLADGSVIAIGDPHDGPDEDPRIVRIATSIENLIGDRRGEVTSRFPRVRKNASGYNLPDALRTSPIDLRKLVIGSEGTLGIISQLTLRTAQLPEAVGGILLLCSSYDAAVSALQRMSPDSFSGAEFMDASFLSMGDISPEWVPASNGPLVYVDIFGSDRHDIEDKMTLIGQAVEGISGVTHRSLDDEGRSRVFRMRREVSERINFEGSFGKASFIEDVSVPLEHLGRYIAFISDLLSSKSISYALYGHAAEGNIHCSPFIDIRNLEHYRMIDEIASRVAEHVIALGGSLSGEHGDGFVRTPFLERAYGPLVFRIFKGIKDIFDPRSMFNPGVKTGRQEASILHDIATS